MTSIGHVYMIITPLDNSFCYIGSTFNRLHKRFQSHKYAYKNKSNYGTLSIHEYFDKYGIDNFKIIKIKSYNVIRDHKKDFKHLYAYETLWINKTKNCINKITPFQPLRKEAKKIYRESHKDVIKCIQKKYYENNKHSLLDYQKEYRQNNRDSIKLKHKDYRDKNSDKIKAHKNKKFMCECGGQFTNCHKATHFRTTKHQNYLKNQ